MQSRKRCKYFLSITSFIPNSDLDQSFKLLHCHVSFRFNPLMSNCLALDQFPTLHNKSASYAVHENTCLYSFREKIKNISQSSQLPVLYFVISENTS